MKKQINFSDGENSYCFTLKEDNKVIFKISKETLVFSSDDFYKLFFQGLDEKPEYDLINSGDELKGQAKHVFETVDAILKKTCSSIDADWFKESDDQSVADDDVLNEHEIEPTEG